MTAPAPTATASDAPVPAWVRAMSASAMARVEAVLTEAPRPPREIGNAIPDLARSTVRQALSALAILGRAESEGPECARRYARPRRTAA